MFDPRDSLIGLFTNSKVSASTEYGTEYVKVCNRENYQPGTLSDNDTGVLVLEEPIIDVRDIGGTAHEDVLLIKGNLWVTRKEGMKNPQTFINSIINTIETTTMTNRTGLSGCGYIRLTNVEPYPMQNAFYWRRLTFRAVGFTTI
jgi:hypothetical protein